MPLDTLMLNVTDDANHAVTQQRCTAEGYAKVAATDFPAISKDSDSIKVWEGGTPVVVTASALVLTGAGEIIGYHINSHTVGATFRFSDALTATTPYLGAAVTTVATTLPGTFTKFPAAITTGVYVTISGTIDMTIFVRS